MQWNIVYNDKLLGRNELFDVRSYVQVGTNAPTLSVLNDILEDTPLATAHPAGAVPSSGSLVGFFHH